MKSLFLWIILAAGLGVLATVSLGQPSDQAVHSGKTVEEWFQMYVAGAGTRVSPASPARNGEFIRVTPGEEKPDPVWQAFDALGEKAVPCLVLHLHTGSATAARATTTNQAPTKALPEPTNRERAELERRQAIELLHRLGNRARAAAPTLLALLLQSDAADAEEVCAALRSIRPDPQTINQFLLNLRKLHHDADVLKFASRLGWSGPEVARRIGELAQSSDPETCRSAISLLEAAGQGARPAADQIVEVLKNPDSEIRYLAARSLSQLATNTPVALKALQALAEDRDEMVRNVARRTLATLEESAAPRRIGN